MTHSCPRLGFTGAVAPPPGRLNLRVAQLMASAHRKPGEMIFMERSGGTGRSGGPCPWVPFAGTGLSIDVQSPMWLQSARSPEPPPLPWSQGLCGKSPLSDPTAPGALCPEAPYSTWVSRGGGPRTYPRPPAYAQCHLRALLWGHGHPDVPHRLLTLAWAPTPHTSTYTWLLPPKTHLLES